MTSIVYPYLHQKSQGEELKYSIRSVCKFAQFDFEPVIIGDKPAWYSGKHIQVSAIRNRRFTRAFDIAKKLEIICGTASISDDFVYMYDDQYFVNPVELSAITGAIAMSEIQKKRETRVGSEVWRELMNATIDALLSSGHYKVYNYETHLPRVLNKRKLKLVMDAYNLIRTPLLFNTLYFNEFYANPRIEIEKSNPIKAGVYKPMSSDQIRNLCRDKLVLNNGERGWNHSFNLFLKNTFPEKCRFEL